MRLLLLAIVGLSAGVIVHQGALFLRYVLQVEAERRRQVAEALGVVGGEAPRRWKRELLGRGSIAGLRKAHERLIERAGQEVVIGFAEFVAISLGFAAIAAVGSSLVGVAAIPSLLLAVIAGSLPWLWLRHRAAKRCNEITRLLPGFMDLLVLSVESGLDFTSGVERIIERATPSALTEEMRMVLLEIRLGATRRGALRNLADRLRIGEVRTLASAIIQADRYGVPLGRTLRMQSEQVRAKRFQRAEERAGRAAVLISLPTVLFLVPCVFLILVGPYVPEVMRSLESGF
ncbi:MAG: hypothetical protein CME06_14315 [Gemmatimonadetes bacterium]|nr:hypothetical protein [Gemmatimonadota bacterium]